ncbi:DUF397 domain-containing protein [Streptomyces benahoarensis]|uniref:DUF397 domain-containing protein n=1 Tax=Streptomyces benahoarensis TaxID=2595054 RepID=UPI00203527FD|nr:DUF397 domain-containing protein [Streptomyces benahoarensis]
MKPEIVTPFRKSSHSGQNGDCVEVARTSANGRAVRDSKRPAGPRLTFEGAAWDSFVRALKGDASS